MTDPHATLCQATAFWDAALRFAHEDHHALGDRFRDLERHGLGNRAATRDAIEDARALIRQLDAHLSALDNYLTLRDLTPDPPAG